MMGNQPPAPLLCVKRWEMGDGNWASRVGLKEPTGQRDADEWRGDFLAGQGRACFFSGAPKCLTPTFNEPKP